MQLKVLLPLGHDVPDVTAKLFFYEDDCLNVEQE